MSANSVIVTEQLFSTQGTKISYMAMNREAAHDGSDYDDRGTVSESEQTRMESPSDTRPISEQMRLR